MNEINYEELIGQWHKDRNLIDGSTDKDQYMKLIQEAGELSDSLCKGKDIKDDIFNKFIGEKLAIVFGSEEKGISSKIRTNCDFLISIGRLGKTNSFPHC